jgi:hypothetical protein
MLNKWLRKCTNRITIWLKNYIINSNKIKSDKIKKDNTISKLNHKMDQIERAKDPPTNNILIIKDVDNLVKNNFLNKLKMEANLTTRMVGYLHKK